MEFEDTRTPRTLIRYITENKLATIRSKSQRRKRIKSPVKWEESVQPDSETSPTPRTLIRNVLKEKEAGGSSIYIPRHRSHLGKSVEKDPTPAFKRRAIERKRSLKSSRIATPEKFQKDDNEIASKSLEVSSPLPYLLRYSKRRQITIQEFAQGVRQIRRKRELASASDSNEQSEPGRREMSSESDLPETEVWESNSAREEEPLASTHGAKEAPTFKKIRRRRRVSISSYQKLKKTKDVGKHEDKSDRAVTEESDAGTEILESDKEKKGEPKSLTDVTEKILEEKLSGIRKHGANISNEPIHSKKLPEAVSEAETEVWDSEGFGPTDRHLAAINLPMPPNTTQIAEDVGIEEDKGNLYNARRQDKLFTDTSSEKSGISSLPETVIWESDAEKKGMTSSGKRKAHPLLSRTSDYQATKEIAFLDLQKEKLEQLEVPSDNEKLPPSEDEIPELEVNSFHALETLEEEEEDIDEEIIPIKAKDADQPKKGTRKKASVPRLPPSLTTKLFQHYCGMPVSREALELVESCCDAYFEQLTGDLLAYSNHAGRKTIEPEDMELLLRRQGFITDERSLYTLVEKYLPLEYRQEIIPMATAHNVIIPKN